MIDKFLFRTKPWQAFLIFLAYAFFPAILSFPLVEMYVNMFVWLSISCWLGLLGVRLKTRLPTHYELPFRIFIVSVVILTVSGTIAYSFPLQLNEWLKRSGWNMALYGMVLLFVLCYVVLFIARAMKSLETHDRATVKDYFNDIFLWWLFPIGIWFLQKRLNFLYDQFFEVDDRATSQQTTGSKEAK